MDIQVSDIVHLKKAHPCGSHSWYISRIGMDFKLRCEGCQHEVMVPRSKVERNIKKLYRNGVAISLEK